jgi:predicted GIY-YIG superfamily endonuclease
MLSMHYVYILRCADGSYYVGSTWNLEKRIEEHSAGIYQGYTSRRLPVELVWSCDFSSEHDAFLVERQLKGWSRAKKEALIRGDLEGVHEIVRAERLTRDARKWEK